MVASSAGPSSVTVDDEDKSDSRCEEAELELKAEEGGVGLRSHDWGMQNL